jgi:hypothetical protein
MRQVEYSIKQLFSVFGWTDSRTQNYRLKNDDMKKNCVNCHFLAKKTLLKDNNSISDSISSEERVKLKSQKVKPTFDLYTTTLCHKGVWDEGILPHQDYYSSTVSKSRNSCFFFSHQSMGSVTLIDQKLNGCLWHLRDYRLNCLLSETVVLLSLNNNNASLIFLSTIELNYQPFGIAKCPFYQRKSTGLNLVNAV